MNKIENGGRNCFNFSYFVFISRVNDKDSDPDKQSHLLYRGRTTEVEFSWKNGVVQDANTFFRVFPLRGEVASSFPREG